jgi:hypothetical protein
MLRMRADLTTPCTTRQLLLDCLMGRGSTWGGIAATKPFFITKVEWSLEEASERSPGRKAGVSGS